MWRFLTDWGPWLAAIGGIIGIIGWASGLSSVLKIVSTLIDVLSPLLKAIVSAVVAGLGWFWRMIIWPDDPKQPSFRRGVHDICDDWVTIATVIALFWGLWTVMDYRHDRTVDQLGTCQTEVVKLKKLQKKPPKQQEWFKLW